ncbi:sesquipedalian-1-like, partial [Brachyhypopomus gauderio]|uniref:sesquipedalian-1-like n=1 Tax=Brachyhypopomus gauderio TaxID=698409 RepID=UPI00404211FF
TCGDVSPRVSLVVLGTRLQGEVNTSYQKRWFTLRGNLLFYQDRPGDRVVLGVIVLEGCVPQLCESEEQFAFSLAFGTGGGGLRTYKFSAESQEKQESWVKAIHSAQHSFLSLLLQDLRQQYLEAAKTAGVEVVECPPVAARGISYPSCTFYMQPGVTGPGAPINRQVTPPVAQSNRPISKRSPKLWPKRHAHVPALEGMAPPPGEWPEPTEDFCQMHENFGMEVRRLMAEWRKKSEAKAAAKAALPEEDLIDLG